MFHPVWSMSDLPIVERVYGSFLIALQWKVSCITHLYCCRGTYVSNWWFLVWSDSVWAGFSSFRDRRYCSHRSFISSDSFLNFSFINSFIIANLPFGASSPGWSDSHWILYSFHFLSTSGFHWLSYVNAWYACQAWSIFGCVATLRRFPLLPEFTCRLLLWNHSLTRWKKKNRWFFVIQSFYHAHTLSYFSLFFLVANSFEPSASSNSSCVTGGTGHFSRNSLNTVGKNSLVAVLFIFAARYSVLRDSSHSFWSLEVQGLRVIANSL